MAYNGVIYARTLGELNVAAKASLANNDGYGFFSSIAHKMGLGHATADTTAAMPPPSPAPAKSKVAEVRHSETKAAARPTEPKQASHAAAPKPAVAESRTASDPSAQPPRDSLVGGAQPILSANSFESRFSATK